MHRTRLIPVALLTSVACLSVPAAFAAAPAAPLCPATPPARTAACVVREKLKRGMSIQQALKINAVPG